MQKREDNSSLALQDKKFSFMMSESNKSPQHSSPSQPFIFRQYTVREIVTPTKNGNISMKEVSFGMCTGGEWSPSCSKSDGKNSLKLDFFMSPNSKPKDEQGKGLLALSHKPFWTSSDININGSSESADGLVGSLEKSSLRSRNRHVPPTKKKKFDAAYYDLKKSKRTTVRGALQIKEVQKLHRSYILMISLLPIVMLFAITYCTFSLHKEVIVQEASNLKHLYQELSENVFGQEEAIISFLGVLNNASKEMTNAELKVTLITGASGVGKSLVSSIAVNNFPLPGKAALVLLPLPPPKVVFQKFSERGHNMIVIDSLSLHSIPEVINWVQNVFNEAVWQNKSVLFVLVFNVQVWNGESNGESDDVFPETLRAKGDTLQNKLKSLGVHSHHIHFKLLSKEHINKCIKVALQKRGIHDSSIINKYMDVLSTNINPKKEGCKSVWSRTGIVSFD